LSNLKSIAVVEDDASLLAALENFIGSHGIVVHGFPNAESFLARKDSIQVDCLITDVRMDGMGGVGLFDTMRRIGDTTPVVFITAFDDERIHRQVMSTGAIAYFHKPFDCEYVIECIETCLAILSTSDKEKNMPDINNCIQD
jgi:FixJ family two-component response regulator